MSTETVETIAEAEVVVVGGGPAGAACAARLAELGRDVLVVEKSEFPRDKACGDGITPLCATQLRMLDLDWLVDDAHPITGLRGNLDYRHSRMVRFKRKPVRDWHAYTIGRCPMDDAILGAARERGARLLTARVDRPLLDGDRVTGVRVHSREHGEAVVAARYLVAADGATSRLRRELGVDGPEGGIRTYGIRQYFRTERRLDPCYDIYVPLEHNASGLVGYGWVFPLGDHEANFGLGYVEGPGLGEPGPIREMFAQFVKNLSLRLGERFGDVEPIGKHMGSPVGIGFSSSRCQAGDVFLVGDAARMTDPITGEGIAYALVGGRRIAELVDRTARIGRNGLVAGKDLARRFPRLGMNVASFARVTTQMMNSGGAGGTDGESEQPHNPTVKRLVLNVDPFDPWWSATPVGQLVTSLDEDAARELEAVNHEALDAIDVTAPFVREALAKLLVSGAGPVGAATVLLAARACGGGEEPALRGLARAAAYAPLIEPVLAEVVDSPKDAPEHLNNAGIVLMSDFVLTRAWAAQAGLPLEATRELAEALESTSSGVHMVHEDRYDWTQGTERHLATIDTLSGRLLGTVAGVAASLAGAPELAEPLRRYGRHLACAYRLAAGIVELLVGDDVSAKAPGYEVARGFYSLPVLAAARDADLRRLLVRGLDLDDSSGFIEAVRASGGLEDGLAECRAAAERAKAAVADAPLVRPELLAALADSAVEHAERSIGSATSGEREGQTLAGKT
jgi:geranylgeranyl reductase family protein